MPKEFLTQRDDAPNRVFEVTCVTCIDPSKRPLYLVTRLDEMRTRAAEKEADKHLDAQGNHHRVIIVSVNLPPKNPRFAT